MASKIEISTEEANIMRTGLRMVIAVNESVLEGLRRMSMRQASLREEEATLAARRIVAARNALAKLERI